MFTFKFIFVFLAVSLCAIDINAERPFNIWEIFNFNKINEQEANKSPNTFTKCIGCSANKLDEELTIEEELTKLRIEYIKQQILKKLRLKEKPSVSLPIGGLPKPLVEDESFIPRNQENMIENDHYYGKTTQAIIFPSEGQSVFVFVYI